MRYLPVLAACCGLALPATAQTKPVLTVYTYDSFAAEWGPGPAVKAGFEAGCGCELRWVTAGDGAALLARVLLEGSATEADVVLGLDQNLIPAAQESGLFAPAPTRPKAGALPVDWTNGTFAPFDWGWFAFVYDATKIGTVPASFEELAASDLKIVIEDPRSSTPGLGLLLWVKAAYGDRSGEIWAGLSDNILTITPGWSEAYGLFLKGEADMVLSYTTSPVYHRMAEGDGTREAAIFREGHMLQVEVAAKLAGSDQGALADRFLKFMESPAFQSAIPQTNWMYPSNLPLPELPLPFQMQKRPEKTLFLTAGEVAALRDPALAEWREVLSR
ncbi:MAG: thiamine ABC transporter substrate binding subunit [Paracoccaceae bacterium]